jgi:exodeoxyribonuclease VII small subunit
MKKTANFEAALKRLEEIVEKMENGDAELDKSLELYEEGIKLVKICSSKLEEAKKKVQILAKDGDKMKLEQFKQSGDSEE